MAVAEAPAPDALDRFEAMLREGESATATLRRWMGCDDPGAPRLRARHESRAGAEPDAARMARLEVADPARIACRRARLMVGRRIVSEAENWYVPDRLTPEMRDRLDRSDEPFGQVIAGLAPRREILETVRPRDPDGSAACAAVVLVQHALLRSGGGLPLCEVRERYTRNILRAERAA